jgi:hypothetical protein
MLEKIKIESQGSVKTHAQKSEKAKPVEKTAQEGPEAGTVENAGIMEAGENVVDIGIAEGDENEKPDVKVKLRESAGGTIKGVSDETSKPSEIKSDVKVTESIPRPSTPMNKSKRGKIFHLGVSAAYMTGFTEDFNTGGVELSGILTVYGPVALRLDAGFHPVGGAGNDDVSYRYYTLPLDVMGGYYKDFRKLHIGVYGGLNMMAMWFDYQAANMGSSFDFVIGAALLLEAAYIINPTISLGVFIRPAYISDDVIVSDNEYNADDKWIGKIIGLQPHLLKYELPHPPRQAHRARGLAHVLMM